MSVRAVVAMALILEDAPKPAWYPLTPWDPPWPHRLELYAPGRMSIYSTENMARPDSPFSPRPHWWPQPVQPTPMWHGTHQIHATATAGVVVEDF